MSITPLQRIEWEKSEARRRALFVREELANASEEAIQVLVFSKIGNIMPKTGFSEAETKDLQRLARMRVIMRWLGEMGFNV